MTPGENPSTAYARQALRHVQILAGTPRGSATPAEKAAADYASAQLRAAGVTQIETQPFTGLRSIWLFLALVFGLALVGHAAYWFLRRPIGEYLALLVALLAFGMSGVMLWRRFTFRSFPLRSNLPQGASQNVIAVLPPQAETRRQVVLLSHLDSHRAVFWFATDLLVKIFAVTSLITLYGVFAAMAVYLLAVLSGWQGFAWIGVGLAVFHFLGWFTGVTADLGAYSPGANDNASSAGTLLALAERLKSQPLQNTAVWLAFTGCEESGCDGILALLEKYGSALKQAVFIDLEMVGIGERLGYIREEGNLHRRRIPDELAKLLNEVGEPFGIQAASTPPVGAFTEAGALWEHGYQAACISIHRSGSAILPEWHRLTDTPSHVQVEALQQAHEFTWALLQRLDQDN